MNRQGQDPSVPTRVRRGVVGVLERRGRLLVIRRADGVARGGTWCFPGGHVERNEIPRRAVTREFMEELGIDVVPWRRLGAVRIMDSRYVLAVWAVRQLSGEIRPAPNEIAEVRWLEAAELRAIRPSLPSNELVLQLLGL